MIDLERRFTYHPPREGQPADFKAIRNRARRMAETVDDLCPDGREKALAITKIEEAVMWANAAIARGGE